MKMEANGVYENVEADEVPYGDRSGSASLSRGTVRRRFQGEITGDSVADVLIARGAADRLGYVATDLFTGRVGDRTGTFVFQHGGTIDLGVLSPFGYVVPGSGTGQLAGLTGEILVRFIPPAAHSLTLHYDFER
jgi:Protein of unknown function (DUF3224)